MRRAWARAGIGLLVISVPALADMRPDDPARTRAAVLARLQAQLAAERAEAMATAVRLTALSPMIHHPRAARPE